MNQRILTIKYRISDRLNGYRAVIRYLEGAQFADAWARATEEQRKHAEELCSQGHKHLVEEWARAVIKRTGGLDAHSVAELRDMARALGIPYYNHKSKEDLLKELQ